VFLFYFVNTLTMHRFVLLVASLVVCGVSFTSATNWALVVAGSNGYYNYRHQADTCHAYQVLHKYGIPDENIVVMMYDDIAQNTQNPTKGVVINHPNGADVYHGVPKDYTGNDVTPKNFMSILLGDKAAMKGIGSGKVIESGPNDNVFVFYTDHGAVGLVAFPAGGMLYAKDLLATINTMHTQNKYKYMTIYIEACESGSMLENLPTNINVYGTTASNPTESSYACYYDATRQAYLGDLYSVNWMEDSDVEDINSETLFKQFGLVRDRTNLSHVMQYGDLKLGATHNVGEFQGAAKEIINRRRNPIKERYNSMLRKDAVQTVDVRLSVVSRRLAVAEDNSAEKAQLERELIQLINDRTTITKTIQRIAGTALAATNTDSYPAVTQTHMKLTQHDCYKTVTQRVQEKCFDLPNEYVLNNLYIMANLCEVVLDENIINQAVDSVCRERLSFNY
jgi:legumain